MQPQCSSAHLRAFSDDRLSKENAVHALGLRDYSDLLLALGEANLPLPTLPPQEIEAQAAAFVRLWQRT